MYHLPRFPMEIANVDWFYHAGCVCNHINALVNRVGACVPYPTASGLQTLEGYARLLASAVGRHPQLPLQRVVNGFKGMRRKRYQRALDDYRLRGLLKTDAKVKMFVKIEGIRFRKDKKNPACRAIQWRNPVFTLLAASFYKRIEEALYELDGCFGFPSTRFIAKNLNPKQRAQLMYLKYLGLPGCEMFEFDASRFDAHITEELIRRVENIFWALCNNDPEFAKILHSKLKTHGSFTILKQKIRYFVMGGRMSGDADTAASNCILMACMLTAFGHHLTEKFGGKFDFLCDGDDSVFYYTGPSFENKYVVDYFRQFGMTMEVGNRSRIFEQISFCQGKPCKINGDWLLVRDPVKIMSKTTVNPKFKNPKMRPKLLKTIATGELSIYAGVPIVDAFLSCLIRSADLYMSKRGKKTGGLMRGDAWQTYRTRRDLPANWTSGRSLPVTHEARESFSLAWNISIDKQLEMEKFLDSWTCEIFSPETAGNPVNIEPWEFDWLRPEVSILG